MDIVRVCISSLTRYKQKEFAINIHQIYIFIMSNCLAVLTENLSTSQSPKTYPNHLI